MALLSAFRNGLSAPLSAFRPNVTLAWYLQAGGPQSDVNVVPAGWEVAESGKYVDVIRKWSRYFTLTHFSELIS
jgi:hypothetical protein